MTELKPMPVIELANMDHDSAIDWILDNQHYYTLMPNSRPSPWVEVSKATLEDGKHYWCWANDICSSFPECLLWSGDHWRSNGVEYPCIVTHIIPIEPPKGDSK